MANQRKNQQTVLEALVLGILRGIAALFRLIFRRWQGRRGLSWPEKQEIIRRRLEIEEMLKSENIHELRQAVFEADKLVDRVLRGVGFAGESMGERLKNAHSKIDRQTYESIWQGHKVRNQLAHEHSQNIDWHELRGAAEKLLKYIKTI
ncbi:MAG: hypothetical protein AAB360_00485 [Patescibacteria group bacterium]